MGGRAARPVYPAWHAPVLLRVNARRWPHGQTQVQGVHVLSGGRPIPWGCGAAAGSPTLPRRSTREGAPGFLVSLGLGSSRCTTSAAERGAGSWCSGPLGAQESPDARRTLTLVRPGHVAERSKAMKGCRARVSGETCVRSMPAWGSTQHPSHLPSPWPRRPTWVSDFPPPEL